MISLLSRFGRNIRRGRISRVDAKFKNQTRNRTENFHILLRKKFKNLTYNLKKALMSIFDSIQMI